MDHSDGTIGYSDVTEQWDSDLVISHYVAKIGHIDSTRE